MSKKSAHKILNFYIQNPEDPILNCPELCLLEIKLAKLTHYTIITIQVFVIAHVFVQSTACVELSL